MRSQHLVTQELEQLRQDLNFRMQQPHGNFASKSHDNLNDPADGPNLTNPKRVRKLTKFFGEDPPLMRLFLKKLGYEVNTRRPHDSRQESKDFQFIFLEIRQSLRVGASGHDWAAVHGRRKITEAGRSTWTEIKNSAGSPDFTHKGQDPMHNLDSWREAWIDSQ